MTTQEVHVKNAVLQSMCDWIEEHRAILLAANLRDLQENAGIDQVLIDRLKIDQAKIDGMILSLRDVMQKQDPIHQLKSSYQHPNGMKVENRTAPFGNIMIIYESRPDVTIEAAAIAFKSGNRIYLKGGKEALHSNLALVDCWHSALSANNLDPEWIQYLNLNRKETQQFLIDHKSSLDLIVPRGGEGLIRFVKENALCPVLISGRGNNFLYIDNAADLAMATNIILNGKLTKVSACNALDKVIVHKDLPEKEAFLKTIIALLKQEGVTVYNKITSKDEGLWHEEFLDYKILFGEVNDVYEAIEYINKYAGGHSASIVTAAQAQAEIFMQGVDVAAVYHNASTRFTDGGQFGMGAELAISTDKMHHRGPLGLEQLVTNKWYIYGDGQTR